MNCLGFTFFTVNSESASRLAVKAVSPLLQHFYFAGMRFYSMILTTRACRLLLVCLLLPMHASAEGMVNLIPYVSADMTFDDNVFRFGSAQVAQATFGDSKRSDVIKRFDTGMTANINVSRQVLRLNATVMESRYNHFDLLDNQATNYGLYWDWQLGNLLSGNIGMSQSSSMAGFAEIRTAVKNIRDIETKTASARYLFHPSWSVSGSLTEQLQANDAVSFRIGDREDTTKRLALTYRNAIGNSIELSYSEYETLFPNRRVSIFGDSTIQDTLGLAITWSPDALWRISASVAKVDVHYPENSIFDVEGKNLRTSVSYLPTDKTTLSGSIYKEISPVQDLFATFIETRGVQLNPTWQITSKLNLNGQIAVEHREFLGDPGVFSGSSGARSDISRTRSLGLRYQVQRNTSIRVQYSGEDRSSTSDNRSYEFNSLNFLVRYDWD